MEQIMKSLALHCPSVTLFCCSSDRKRKKTTIEHKKQHIITSYDIRMGHSPLILKLFLQKCTNTTKTQKTR